ncbi:MAG: Sec-independent protein translocase protein TatB [Cellvibrio sp.]|uniref:Sec-independent protein translocase protein TatB n=1 Tax=Cellvibrio sp. TaxID=1965322 RepID=UPI00271ED9A4|nr:Sec-independent protein translocase protein TatB [Cellvibrio sp.]
MFDIGFAELLVCLVVALVVIGPEQLPGAVRTAGLWIGRLKRSLRDTRNEIERQIGADDIRRQLHNEEVLQNIEEARIKFEKTLLDVQHYEDADAEARRQASDYGPPDELPDHAHDNETSAANNKPATPAVTHQPSPAPSTNSPVVSTNSTVTTDTSGAPASSSTSTNTHQAASNPAQSGSGH